MVARGHKEGCFVLKTKNIHIFSYYAQRIIDRRVDDAGMCRGTPYFRRHDRGSWFQNRRFRQRKVGGATVVRLPLDVPLREPSINRGFALYFSSAARATIEEPRFGLKFFSERRGSLTQSRRKLVICFWNDYHVVCVPRPRGFSFGMWKFYFLSKSAFFGGERS